MKYVPKHPNEPIELVEGLGLGIEGNEGVEESKCKDDEEGRSVRKREY
jgi:hypothetical protein